jgi:hypothetical protein
MPLAARQPSAITASSQAATTPTASEMCRCGSCLRSTTTNPTGHASVAAAVRHGTYQRAIGGDWAMTATTTGSASSDQRTGAEGSAAGSEL